MKKYYLETLSEGCPKNILESAQYRAFLEQSGHEVVDRLESADLILLNTCGCLQTLQDKAKSRIEVSLKEKKSQAQLVVAGCYPLIDKANKLKEAQVSSFDPGQIDQLAEIISSPLQSINVSSLSDKDLTGQPNFVTKPNDYFLLLKKIEQWMGFRIPKIHHFFKSIMMSSEFYYLNTGKGCSGNCTFCGIKLAIGSPKSRPIDEIVNHFRSGILSGKKDFWLVADDLGSWGTDQNTNSSTLLKEILSIPAPFNLVLNYFEPEMLLLQKEAMLRLLKDRRIIQICLPLQTGSQRLLKKMGRHYSIAEVRNCIEEIRRLNPNLVIKTQLIVGFPDETWSDFMKTVQCLGDFDGIGVNAYARLPFTAAYKLKPLSARMVKIRYQLMKLFITLHHMKFILLSLARSRS